MKIPLSRVHIDDKIKQRILEAVDSENFILGKECTAFEEELAKHTGTRHCILAPNWTSGVFLLLQSMGIKKGDEIIVPSHTAFPSVEPIVQVGAKPVFIDVDESYTLDVRQIDSLITSRTVGILPVHLYGHPFEVDSVRALAAKRGLFWIEDCAQAHGAEYKGKRVGSMGTHGAYSFYPSKNLTVYGDGGCITTNDDAIADKIRMLRNHGRKDKFTHEIVGYNMRFNEIQAVVGREQLKLLDTFNEKRRQAVSWYRDRLSHTAGVQLPIEREGCKAVYHMFVIQTDQRDAMANHLKSKGIVTGIHYPVANHKQPAITSLYSDIPALPVTERIVDRILSLPIFPNLTEEEVDYVCTEIKSHLEKVSPAMGRSQTAVR